LIPIYEQGSGNGIGHGLDSFLNRFDCICSEHRKEGRAKAFAFIFYDFTDKAIRHILKNQGVFAKLDRLSGKELSVFYLHAGTRHAIETFNINFLAALGAEDRASLPCVVFFHYENDLIRDVEIAQLESADLIHGFKELYEVISSYIQRQPMPSIQSKTIVWLKSGTKFIGIEVFRAGLKKGLEFLF
jgi:hypothetical protein